MTDFAYRYDTFHEDGTKLGSRPRHYRVKVARSLNDLMHVIALRASVFISEQACPFAEEFDGNDFCAAHLVAYRADEPIACIRVRCFADFAKIERLTVKPEFRPTRVSTMIVWAAIDFARKKGYGRIYGHAQDRFVKFWSNFGAAPMRARPPLIFSDFSYTEMLLETEPDPDPITLASDPYTLIRPEGAWHRPGVLEASARRVPSVHIAKLHAA